MEFMRELDTWFENLSNMPDMDNVHNLYSRYTTEGQIRLANLKRYFAQMLEYNPGTLLVGEAPGYQGAYRTGVPFCSESILLGPKNSFGLFGGSENGYDRVYEDDRIWKEPSATIVQRTLEDMGEPVLLWAAFPLHPHQPDKHLSNRTPSKYEISQGGDLLWQLIDILQPQRVVAIGNVAESCLNYLSIPCEKVRHPAHGGATKFRSQLVELVDNSSSQKAGIDQSAS